MSNHDWVIVYTGGSADTALLRDVLEAAGITARLGDEMMGTIAPYVIAGGTTAAVKVIVPAGQADEARAMVAQYTERHAVEPPSGAFEPWECACCHEQNDGTFDICWNCQTDRVR